MKPSEKPPYPECILPQPSYRAQIIEAELYAEDNRLVIQRRCDGDTGCGEITPETFGKNLKLMSVNLLGGPFNPDFIKFNPHHVRPFPSEECFDGEYDFFGNAAGVYIHIPKIHNGKFPSPRKFPDMREYEKVSEAIISDREKLLAAFGEVKDKKSKDVFSKDREYNVNYRICVAHRPTNANYWHCQIEIAPDSDDGKTVDKDKAEWQKKALRALTNFLIPHTSFAPPDPIPQVKPEWYVTVGA